MDPVTMDTIALSILGVSFSISEILPLVSAIESNGILDTVIRINRRFCESHSSEENTLIDDGASDHYRYWPRYVRSRAQSPILAGENLV